MKILEIERVKHRIWINKDLVVHCVWVTSWPNPYGVVLPIPISGRFVNLILFLIAD